MARWAPHPKLCSVGENGNLFGAKEMHSGYKMHQKQWNNFKIHGKTVETWEQNVQWSELDKKLDISFSSVVLFGQCAKSSRLQGPFYNFPLHMSVRCCLTV